MPVSDCFMCAAISRRARQKPNGNIGCTLSRVLRGLLSFASSRLNPWYPAANTRMPTGFSANLLRCFRIHQRASSVWHLTLSRCPISSDTPKQAQDCGKPNRSVHYTASRHADSYPECVGFLPLRRGSLSRRRGSSLKASILHALIMIHGLRPSLCPISLRPHCSRSISMKQLTGQAPRTGLIAHLHRAKGRPGFLQTRQGEHHCQVPGHRHAGGRLLRPPRHARYQCRRR